MGLKSKMKKPIDKVKKSHALMYEFPGNTFVFTISLMLSFALLISFTFDDKDRALFLIITIPGAIYILYRIIYIIMLSNKINSGKSTSIKLISPKAKVIYINRKDIYNNPGIIIKGIVNEKRQKIKLYDINLSKKEMIKLAKEISSKDEVEYELVYKTNIIANYKRNISFINSKTYILISKGDKISNLYNNKLKKVKFNPVEF